MSLLKNLVSDDSIANETDFVGGGGVLESGLYDCTVKLAYVNTAASGALGLVLHAQAENGREIRETLWMTSGTAKGGKNYYEKDGQKHYLPGYLMANSLSLLTTGKEISELEHEEKVINAWNRDAKAEVPTKVNMIMDLVNKPILAGVIKETVDRTTKDNNGVYQPTGETRNQNVFDKFFRASDKKTTAEIRAETEEANFYQVWEDKWKGKTINRSTGVAGTAGAPGAAKTAAVAAKKPTQSLFA